MDAPTLFRQFDPASIDLVLVDAICATGLPGMERLDVGEHLRRVNDLAASCRQFTESVMAHFWARQCDYPESEGKFRIQALVTHVQRDLGLRYHPERRKEEAFCHEDSFLDGILFGRGGTCGSLPLLYTAVGRRLCYPIKLVTTSTV